MDWRTVRFDWNRVRAFLVTAEEGSFSAAAKALGMTQPTLGRQVAALEEELGVLLFSRVGSTLELTEAGLGLMEHARQMGEAANRLSLAATGRSSSIEGVVSITASELISAYLLPPVIAKVRQQHPGIELEIVASNTARDLVRREADIAVRNFQSDQPDLVAKKVAVRDARLYAAPAYLARIGPIDGPAALAKADFFAFDRSTIMVDWLTKMGAPVTAANFKIVCGNHLVQWELCKRGMGICIVMDEVGDREPAVVRVLPELMPIPVPIWITAHRELHTSPRIRVVFDLLAEALGGERPSR
jgi:DNA-binding transcriptional LysR family regulator